MKMVEDGPKPFWSGRVKFVGLALAGGVTGFLLATTIGRMFKDGGALSTVAGAEPALLASAIYLLMGVFVLLGSISPKVGAAVLNVEDADEVREQAPLMLPSAIGCCLSGIALGAVALGGEGGVLTPVVAGAVALAATVIAIVVTASMNRHADELMRAMFRETGSASFYIGSAILGTWAICAHLSAIRAPTPIEISTVVWIAPLLASFWVVGRRGMLKPRG